jgi:hypothetical protein
LEPIEIEVRPLDCPPGADQGGEAEALFAGGSLVLGLSREQSESAPGDLSFDIVAWIRGEGDIRFVDTRWVGRLGLGRWIEALSIVPRRPRTVPPVQCKALTAGGEETPWTDSGAVCGGAGTGTPLIGIAMRQRPGSGAPLFDCEYRGYFQSGATAGPARNGAPCLSATANEPLEGVEIRLTLRGPRTPADAKA